MWVGKGQRGRHRIWSRLQALSRQHKAWCGDRTHRLWDQWDHDLSRSQTLNRPSHPGSPQELASLMGATGLYCSPWRCDLGLKLAVQFPSTVLDPPGKSVSYLYCLVSLFLLQLTRGNSHIYIQEFFLIQQSDSFIFWQTFSAKGVELSIMIHDRMPFLLE